MFSSVYNDKEEIDHCSRNTKSMSEMVFVKNTKMIALHVKIQDMVFLTSFMLNY